MDLLDDLEISPVKCRTFKKTIDIRIEEKLDSESEASDDDQLAPPSTQALDFSNSSILNSSTQSKSLPKAPSISGLFTSSNSLFDRVRRRLNGEPEPGSQDPELTQEIPFQELQTEKIQPERKEHESFAIETQVIHDEPIEYEFDASTQIIQESGLNLTKKAPSRSPSFEQTTQDVTQRLESQSDEHPTESEDNILDTAQEVVPQDETDNEDEDIKPTAKRSGKLFLDSEDEDEQTTQVKSSQTDFTASRLQKIEALAAKKRAERLLREQQQRDKQQKDLGDYKKLSEAVHGEEDENEEGDVSVSTIDPTKKSKALEEKFLLEEQRERISEQLEHEEKVVTNFDKNSLLAAFGMGNTMSSPAKEHSSPITSPMGSPSSIVKRELKTEGGDIELSDSPESDEEANKLTDSKPQAIMKNASKFTLKTPFNRNNLLATNSDVIELGSDSDSDAEVAPSKVTRLEVKSKFSKQTMNKHKAQKKKALSRSQLFLQLREKARSQLKRQNQHNEETHKAAIEEVATEQEAVDKLLDKYIEAANRTREKELEIERRTKLAEETGEEFDDGDYTDDDSKFEGEVPDSDIEEDGDVEGSDDENKGDAEDEAQEVDDDDDDDDDDESAPVVHKKHRKQALMSDDDNEEEEEEEVEATGDSNDLKSKLELDQSETGIDLGSFGGNFSQNFNGLGEGGATQKMKNMFGITMTQAFESESPRAQAGSKVINVFDQLRQNGNRVLGEESFVESSLKDKSFSYSFNSQKHQEINFDEPSTQLSEIDPPTQGLSTQRHSISTLQDSLPIDSNEATIKDKTQDDGEEEDGAEENFKLGRRRLFKKEDVKKLANVSEEDEDDEEETEEQIAARRRQVKLMKEHMRKRDLEQKRKKLEMKRKGIDKIMENEAEESEDEWQGLGGLDGERSDEENSEDEKMLDDYSKLKMNESEIAKFVANEDLQNDEKMLHKILNDVNNGGFRKRGVRNGVELEFSDEEDAYLQQYNRIRNQRMRDKILENGNIAKLAKDAKAQAFFETITEGSQNTVNEIFGSAGTDNDDNDSEDNDPFNDRPEITKEQFQDPSTAPKKRKFKITEAYVHKTLSFLNDDEIERSATLAAHQHGFLDDDDEFCDDLSTLKQKSIIKLPDTTPQRKSTVDLTNETDQSPDQFFKMPSKIMKSFQLKSNGSFKNSNEVTVSTAYKAATSSKASIMSFGKNSSSNKVPTKATKTTASQDTRVLKARRIERTLKKGNRLKSLNIGNFD